MTKDSKLIFESYAISAEDAQQYALGKKYGLKDKLKDVKRDLSKHSPAFVKGYKEIRRESWWMRANDRLTRYLADLGSSRLR
jgi:hypothetical protein